MRKGFVVGPGGRPSLVPAVEFRYPTEGRRRRGPSVDSARLETIERVGAWVLANIPRGRKGGLRWFGIPGRRMAVLLHTLRLPPFAGMTHGEVARALGVSSATIRRIAQMSRPNRRV